MALNPIWNRYNVAPINGIVVIGHRRAMHSGLTRENAMNLLAWLIIATEATPDEITAELEAAHKETPSAASPTIVRDARHLAAEKLKVETREGRVIDIEPVRVVPSVQRIDENRNRMAWRVPLNASGAGGSSDDEAV